MARRRLGAAAAVLLALLAGATLRGQEREARLAFLGDSGTGDANQRAVRDQLLRWPISLAFMLGDNIYDRGSKELFGPRFDDIYAPLMARGTAFHSTLGNHDVSFCSARSTLSDRLSDDADAYRTDILRCDVKAQLTHPGIGYFVSGGGGNKVYDFKDRPGYVATGGGFFHFLYVRLTPERFEYYCVDRDGRPRDAGWWAKRDAADHPFPPGTLPPR